MRAQRSVRANAGTAVPVRAVLLDLDGTLLDHVGAANHAVGDWARSLAPHCTVPPASLHDVWAALEAEHFGAYLKGSCSFDEQRRRRVQAFLPHLGVNSSDVDVDSLFADYLRRYEQAWRPFPDVAAALATLRGQTEVLAVLTNGDDAQQRAKVVAIGIEHLLDDVLTSSALGDAKPAAEAFRAACGALGIRPAATVYVGDDLVNDAIAADAAGLIGVWLDRSGDAPGPTAHRRIQSLLELPAALDATETAGRSLPTESTRDRAAAR